jgi:hypothetical protein
MDSVYANLEQNIRQGMMQASSCRFAKQNALPGKTPWSICADTHEFRFSIRLAPHIDVPMKPLINLTKLNHENFP